MKTFCKLTAQSPAASYVPLPRFLLQDEALRDISNDANLPGVGVQRLDYPKKAGLGQARAYYAELPSGRKAHRKGGRRCTSLTPSSGFRTARSFA